MIAPIRVARNVAEKQRRDKLNAFIADLANTVPLVASATKRLDKTSILRLAAAFLRLHDSPLNRIGYNLASTDIVEGSGSKPKLSLPQHMKSLMEGLEGFVIVVNSDLKLIYVGQACEKFLGHQNIDMMGYPLTAFVHPGDVDSVRHVMEDARRQILRSGNRESSRIQFRCRIKERSQPRTEVVTYQMVQIVGSFQFPSSKETEDDSGSRLHLTHLINNNNEAKDNDLPSCSSSASVSAMETDDTQGSSSFCLPLSPPASASSSSLIPRPRSDSASSGSSYLSTVSSYAAPASVFSRKRKLEEESTLTSSSPAPSCSSLESGGMNGQQRCLSLPPSPALTGILSNNNHDGKKQAVVSATYVAKNLLFKGFVQVIPSSPMAELSLIDANQEEYVTRLSLDGVLLYADHR